MSRDMEYIDYYNDYTDKLISISGLPYDTLHEVIGIKENSSSLKSFNINYLQVDLIDNDFDYKKIEDNKKKAGQMVLNANTENALVKQKTMRFLMQFEPLDIANAGEDIINLYIGTFQTDSVAKKKTDQLTES